MDIRLTNNLIFKFKNVILDKRLNICKFLFTHKSISTMLCIEIDELKNLLEKTIIYEKKVSAINLITNLLDDLFGNIIFYNFQQNNHIKTSTYVNIINLQENIANIIVSSKEVRESNIIKNKIKSKLHDLVIDDRDTFENQLTKNIYKKLWLLINHLDCINCNINKEEMNKLTFTLNDFIFDYYK
jgi:hypothetical protein